MLYDKYNELFLLIYITYTAGANNIYVLMSLIILYCLRNAGSVEMRL